jgi:hypothetical protein
VQSRLANAWRTKYPVMRATEECRECRCYWRWLCRLSCVSMRAGGTRIHSTSHYSSEPWPVSMQRLTASLKRASPSEVGDADGVDELIDVLFSRRRATRPGRGGDRLVSLARWARRHGPGRQGEEVCVHVRQGVARALSSSGPHCVLGTTKVGANVQEGERVVQEEKAQGFVMWPVCGRRSPRRDDVCQCQECPARLQGLLSLHRSCHSAGLHLGHVERRRRD